MPRVRRTAVITALTVGMCGVPAVLTTAQATAAAPSVAKASTWPLVQKGDTGGRVRAIQYLLKARGAKLRVDGVFGTRTVNAVKAFQKLVGLPAVGWVGPKTWPKLITTVQNGSTGNAVSAVQWQLRHEYGFTTLAVDGIFGPKTGAAVKSFQKKYKLAQDGIVGPNTWMALEVHHK